MVHMVLVHNIVGGVKNDLFVILLKYCLLNLEKKLFIFVFVKQQGIMVQI